jgi:SAM-dependent methyltransferase
MPASAKSGEFFHGFADTFDTFYNGKRSPLMQWIDRRFRSDMFERYRLTFARLGDLPGKRVIDIGCGSGPYVVECMKRGAAHVAALDPAPRMLELTRQRLERIDAVGRASFHEGYFPQVRPGSTFDCAIVMGVFDYIAEPLGFLRALRETAGTAAISFPSEHWFRTPFRKVRYRMRNCPVYFYDERRIRQLATDAGWGQVDILKIAGAGMDYHVCLRR